MEIKDTEIKDYLQEYSRHKPLLVGSNLEKGSIVRKSMGLGYEIDDSKIYKKLECVEGKLPYGPIHRALQSNSKKILELFNGDKTIPFSKAFDAGLGECLEKAILVQLAYQELGDGFLVNGGIRLDEDDFLCHHAYNVLVRDEKPYLVDAENPLVKDKSSKIIHPCIIPINKIEDGRFMVNEEHKQGRTYYLR